MNDRTPLAKSLGSLFTGLMLHRMYRNAIDVSVGRRPYSVNLIVPLTQPSLLRTADCINVPIADKGIDPVITRTETPQLHLFAVLDLLCITIAPFHRHV